jgi:AraC-like DNA-binding protein
MRFITQDIPLESNEFPFDIFDGCGENQKEDSYLHNHNCLELNYVVSGTGLYIIGENEYPINPGDLFVINNCEYHFAFSSQEMVLKVIVFKPEMIWQNNNAFDYKYLQTFFEWKNNFRHHFTPVNPMVKEISALFFEIEKEWNDKNQGYHLVIKALLLKMLALLYRGFYLTEETSKSVLKFQSDYNKIIDAVFYIDENYYNPIDLKLLAKLTHLSPNYFSKLFNNVMSTSVSNYINKKRIAHSCLLLKTTQMNVCEISLKSGFNDVSHFNKIFKSLLGVSPKKYRD